MKMRVILIGGIIDGFRFEKENEPPDVIEARGGLLLLKAGPAAPVVRYRIVSYFKFHGSGRQPVAFAHPDGCGCDASNCVAHRPA